jgi:hypothetical protein
MVQQPVLAAIVEKPDDYVFSSHGTKAGLKKLKLLDHDFQRSPNGYGFGEYGS